MSAYLPPGLPQPVPSPDGLDRPYWDGLLRNTLVLQRCADCHSWQWGPEFVCHACLSDNMTWQDTRAEGTIYSFERVWHPVHPALREHGPYVVVLVELPEAGKVRVVGNLLGDPHQDVRIGAAVRGVFEHHADAGRPFALLQWTLA